MPDLTVCNLQMGSESHDLLKFDDYLKLVKREVTKRDHLMKQDFHNDPSGVSNKESGNSTTPNSDGPHTNHSNLDGNSSDDSGLDDKSENYNGRNDKMEDTILSGDNFSTITDLDLLKGLYGKSGYYQMVGRDLTEVIEAKFIVQCNFKLWDFAEKDSVIIKLREKGVKFNCRNERFLKYVGESGLMPSFSSTYGPCFTFR